ncbi:MAG: DNA-processing protein DprA [Aggregatilineales bacterium]
MIDTIVQGSETPVEKQDSTPDASNDQQLPLDLFNRVPQEIEAGKHSILIDDATRNDILVSLLSVASVKGIGFRTVCQLYDSGFFQLFLKQSGNESVRHPIFRTKRYVEFSDDLRERKQELVAHGHQLADKLSQEGITFIPDGHEEYPASLGRLSQRPRWLFVKGNSSILKSQSVVAVIGTRDATSEGLDLSFDCAKELAKRAVVVLSGFARGIDEVALRGATQCLGQSIAVLGHGLISGEESLDHKLWNQIIDSDGIIISEYLPFDPPTKDNFLRRNELQAAISKMVIPIECPLPNSGTGATIRRAIALGTPIVGVVPSGVKEKSLVATREYLLSLKPQVQIVELRSVDFEQTLHRIFPKHDWSGVKLDRQQRFFKRLQQQILNTEERVGIEITDEGFDRFCAEMRSILKTRA